MVKKLLLLMVFFSAALQAGPAVQVSGLFNNAAVLTINGQQHMLRAGQRSPEGVLLISATPKEAVLEIDGQQQRVGLSQRITGQYQAGTAKKEVAIPRNNINQYITYASVNGRRQQVLVDTGANLIAINSQYARQLGIDYEASGSPIMATTASGVAQAYRVKLRSVSVGGIAASGVDAMVIDGDFPHMILLGMSYLQHVDMREQNGTLYLQAKY